MSKFDYCNFNDGSYDIEFVSHARKYTKDQAIDLCFAENDWRFDKRYCDTVDPLRIPTVNDVECKSVRYYPGGLESCFADDGGPIYSYCKQGQRGSFPVWVISFSRLEV